MVHYQALRHCRSHENISAKTSTPRTYIERLSPLLQVSVLLGLSDAIYLFIALFIYCYNTLVKECNMYNKISVKLSRSNKQVNK